MRQTIAYRHSLYILVSISVFGTLCYIIKNPNTTMWDFSFGIIFIEQLLKSLFFVVLVSNFLFLCFKRLRFILLLFLLDFERFADWLNVLFVFNLFVNCFNYNKIEYKTESNWIRCFVFYVYVFMRN